MSPDVPAVCVYVVRYVADDGHMTERAFRDLAAAQAFLRARDGYITRRHDAMEAA